MFRLRLLITHEVYLNFKNKKLKLMNTEIKSMLETSDKGLYYSQYDLYSSTDSVEIKCIFDCLHFSRWQYLLFGNFRHFFLHFLHNCIPYYLIFQNLISGTFISFGVGSLFARWTFWGGISICPVDLFVYFMNEL